MNVASHLARWRATSPTRWRSLRRPARDAARARPLRPLELPQLHRESAASAGACARSASRRGTRTAVMVPPSLELLRADLRAVQGRRVPVMIDPGMGIQQPGRLPRSGRARRVHRHPARARGPRCCSAGASAPSRSSVSVGARAGAFSIAARPLDRRGAPPGRARRRPDRRGRRGRARRDPLHQRHRPACPKGVVYTHGIFVAQVAAIRAIYGIEPGEIDLPTFPLFALFDPALGMTDGPARHGLHRSPRRWTRAS